MQRFVNKTAIVTGASKANGVGAETARRLLQEGAKVVMLDVDEDSGFNLQKKLGANSLFLACNITDEHAVQKAVKMASDVFGDIDILVNNAAVLGYTPVHQTPLEEWNRILSVNLTGQFLCAKHVIPSMLKKNGGVIINLGSAQSFMSQKNVAPYATSKTAILGLTRSIAVDYAPRIRCNAVCPSTIDTPMLRWAMAQSDNPEALFEECVEMHLLKRIAKAQEIAALITFLCSEDAANITGQSFRSDGGIGILIEGSNEYNNPAN